MRELRHARGLSQERLAEAAKIDTKHVQLIEHARTNPTFATLVALAGAFELSLAELLRGV